MERFVLCCDYLLEMCLTCVEHGFEIKERGDLSVG